jgi:putative endonuclease
MKTYYVYILASKPHGVLYIGVTNDLRRRMYEHMNSVNPGFSSTYHTYLLVHYEQTSSAEEAIYREKCLKKWKRAWKINLIEENNPGWANRYHEIK